MKDLTFTKLPRDVLDSSVVTYKTGAESEEGENATKSFLERRLRKADIFTLTEELEKRFPLSKERQVFKKRIRRKGCPKNQSLSNTKKRALGLYNIEREGLRYNDLLALHEMWKSYMDGYLNLSRLKNTGFSGDVASSQYADVAHLIYKADYHGAYISVKSSIAPSLVGIGGILVFETKNTLKLLGKDNITRCVPKLPCEFEIVLDDLRIGFLGKNFMTKPAERASKKLRGKKTFQL
uniref:Ribonuclease P protein subunit p29 n=1 Tax=Lygus hesperus TaxID=30085 RepID=A0A0K8S429_LYGHE